MNYKVLVSLYVLSSCVAARSTPPPTPAVPPKPATTAVLRGTVTNAQPGDSVRVWRKQPGQLLRTARAVAIAPDGAFRLREENVSDSLDVQLGVGSALTLYLQAGDSLNVTVDRTRFYETLRFSGRGVHANNYLARAQQYFDYNFDGLPESQASVVSLGEFVRLVDAYQQRQLDTLAAWQARAPLPEPLLRLRQRVLAQQRELSLLRYAGKVKAATKQEPVLPPDYFAFLRQLHWPPEGVYACQPAELQPVAYMLGAYRSAFLVAPSGRLAATPGTGEQLYARTTADFGETTLRDQIVGDLLVNQLYDFPDEGRAAVRAALPAFRAHNRDSTIARNLREAWRSTAGLQAGSPAPDFTLRDANGKRVSLHDFRGNVVYLDFWYSSCAPCLAEAPAAGRLKKQFQGRDVVFLYVSVDRKAEDWHRALAKYPLTGPTSVHLLDPGATQAAAAYGVGGYPTYWVIGRNGRIWRGGAPRPSAGPETVTLLEQALAARP
ncbi:TlpA family protein disulfide reductase [Hymenobacter sp. HSC-4F20]|uniref:TlpA family protein disulfide reductase n=1 Tax=Hymenobacter sp. HSC-4F20 TaxID=2864135 RepID=UPI001C72B5A4|nr:TlpA disulfide reductase family protein [Hymenobacter sp. HSC-4F20]MBX0289976.1 TlpA family protein disulfide reductase [Hymenobacter sp. HSC-4F20]